MKYAEVESLVLMNCPELRPEQVLPDPDNRAKQCRSLRESIQGQSAELQDIEKRLNNLDDQISRTDDRRMRDRYEAKLRELTERKEEVETAKQRHETELARAEQAADSFTHWQGNLKALQKALKTGSIEIRQRLQSHLRELLVKIEVFSDGHRKIYDADAIHPALEQAARRLGRRDPQEMMLAPEVLEAQDGEAFVEKLFAAEQVPAFVQTKQIRAFIDYATKRLMSREGRFVRLHFPWGGRMDLVPAGSLASGLCKSAESKDGLAYVRPSVEQLWRDFQSGKGKN
jgi:hypothetical protein